MKLVDIYIRHSELNASLKKVTHLCKENDLIYNDEGGGCKAHLKTAAKFTLLTAASPLIALTRMIRSIVFSNQREFIGALITPFIAAACLGGTLLSSAVYLMTAGQVSFYRTMRRTYSTMEAWIHQIELDQADLPSYSNRVSSPLEFTNKIWTTAPCMQPLLEKGLSDKGGLLDKERMEKIFPFLKINGVRMEQDQVVIQSEYEKEEIHYTALNGACEHAKISSPFCCCYQIELIYDRFLCCKVGQGHCASVLNPNTSCSIVSCSACGIGACCCYAKENERLVALNGGCFGPTGPSCIIDCKVTDH